MDIEKTIKDSLLKARLFYNMTCPIKCAYCIIEDKVLIIPDKSSSMAIIIMAIRAIKKELGSEKVVFLNTYNNPCNSDISIEYGSTVFNEVTTLTKWNVFDKDYILSIWPSSTLYNKLVHSSYDVDKYKQDLRKAAGIKDSTIRFTWDAFADAYMKVNNKEPYEIKETFYVSI